MRMRIKDNKCLMQMEKCNRKFGNKQIKIY